MIKSFRIISSSLLVLWMILIFCLSAQTAEISSQTSGGVIAFILKLVYPGFKELSALQAGEMTAEFQFIIRKCAHFSLYAGLGVLSFLSLVTYRRLSLPMLSAFSLSICLLYSITDEIHQLFVPGRSGEIRDVCIDFCGSLIAVLIMFLIIRFSRLKFLRKLRGVPIEEKEAFEAE